MQSSPYSVGLIICTHYIIFPENLTPSVILFGSLYGKPRLRISCRSQIRAPVLLSILGAISFSTFCVLLLMNWFWRRQCHKEHVPSEVCTQSQITQITCAYIYSTRRISSPSEKLCSELALEHPKGADVQNGVAKTI